MTDKLIVFDEVRTGLINEGTATPVPSPGHYITTAFEPELVTPRRPLTRTQHALTTAAQMAEYELAGTGLELLNPFVPMEINPLYDRLNRAVREASRKERFQKK